MTHSDHCLLARVRERDAGAFEILFRRYREPVCRHLAHLVRDENAADDLAQEVFLRLWIRAEQWDGRGLGVLARARSFRRPGIVFASAAATGENDPLAETDSRVFVG